MDHEVLVAMLGSIDALTRQSEVDVDLADKLVALARSTRIDAAETGVSEALIDLARLHRIGALRSSAQADALCQRVAARFGADRFRRGG